MWFLRLKPAGRSNGLPVTSRSVIRGRSKDAYRAAIGVEPEQVPPVIDLARVEG